MILQDVYDQMADGELRTVFAAGGNPEGVVPRAKYERFLPLIILGLVDLHTRFTLREGTLYVDLQDGQQVYRLTTAYAVSNTKSTEPVKFIDDSVIPFEDDLIQIERIYGTYCEDTYQIPLNEIDNGDSIRTPTLDTIEIPTDTEKAPWLLETTQLRINYRANHPKILDYRANSTPAKTEVFLPVSHLQALTLYVASRYTTPMGLSAEFHTGNNYWAKYESECARLEGKSLEITSMGEDTRLTDRGFA